MIQVSSSAIFLLGWVLMLSCSEGEGDSWRGVIRDSMGVTVVENEGARGWPPAGEWVVTPELAIGTLDGEDHFVFGRIADVSVDERNRIFVLDQQAREVRVFDSTGGFLRTLGRAGQGPGELSAFTTDVLTSHGDTVYVPDYAQARVNVYVNDVTNIISLPTRPGGRSWVLKNHGVFIYRGVTIGRDAEARFRTWDGLMRFEASTGQLDTLLIFEYPRTEIGSPEALRVPLIINSPFWTVLGDGRIVWSSLDRASIHIMDSTGMLQRVVRSREWVARPLSADDRSGLVELLREKLTLLGGDASAADWPSVDAPAFLPAITGVRAGPDGTIWVQRMGPLSEIDPMAINASDRSEWLGGPMWDVLDREGRHLGSIEMPPRFRITRIRRDAVYGISRDELGMEVVMRLGLRRGG